jgi:hypothetical protein
VSATTTTMPTTTSGRVGQTIGGWQGRCETRAR